MVRNRKRLTDWNSWSLETMTKAVNDVVSGKMGYTKASKKFGVPKSSLVRRVLQKRNNPSSIIMKHKMGCYRCVFTSEQETVIANYIRSLNDQFVGFTAKEVRSFAYDLAVANGIRNPFKDSKEIAGVDWLIGFLRRHPDISLRKADSRSLLSRAPQWTSKDLLVFPKESRNNKPTIFLSSFYGNEFLDEKRTNAIQEELQNSSNDQCSSNNIKEEKTKCTEDA